MSLGGAFDPNFNPSIAGTLPYRLRRLGTDPRLGEINLERQIRAVAFLLQQFTENETPDAGIALGLVAVLQKIADKSSWERLQHDIEIVEAQHRQR
jgi:hypothetical protein